MGYKHALLIASILSALHSSESSSAERFCRFPNNTPNIPNDGLLAVFGNNGSLESMKNVQQQIWPGNTSNGSIPVRLFTYNESYPVRILYGQSLDAPRGPILNPGSTFDTDKSPVYFTNYCSTDVDAKCVSQQPMAKPSSCGGAAFYFWTAGKVKLLSNMKVRSTPGSWTNFANNRFWNTENPATIIDNDRPIAYRIYGMPQDGSAHIIVDGQDEGPIVYSNPKIYYGKKIQIRLDDLSKKANINYRFADPEAYPYR